MNKWTINRCDPGLLIDAGVLRPEREIALRWWLKAYHRNSWMRRQEGWKELASLLASSCHDAAWINTMRILYCTRRGKWCHNPDFCPRCALDQRVEPRQYEFGRCFDRSPYWYAAVVGTEIDPERAGLHYGPRKKPIHWLPYRGGKRGLYVTSRGEQPAYDLGQEMIDLPFRFLSDLVNRCGVSGALARAEPWIGFGGPARGQKVVDCAVLNHVNVLIASDEVIDLETAKTLLLAYKDSLRRSPLGAITYPDIWINPIASQEDLNGWIDYMFKSWTVMLVVAYQLANCRRYGINLKEFDYALTSLAYYFDQERMIRAYGVLSASTKKRTYIGRRQAMRLTMKKVDRWLKDKAFAWQHQDWEESVYRILDKRRMRRGMGAAGGDAEAREAA